MIFFLFSEITLEEILSKINLDNKKVGSYINIPTKKILKESSEISCEYHSW